MLARLIAALTLVGIAIGCSREEPGSIPRLPDDAAMFFRVPELLRVDQSEPGDSSFFPAPDGAMRWRIWTRDGNYFDALHWGEASIAVLVLPHLDGSEWPYRYFVRRFASEDIEVLAILPPRVAIRERPEPEDLARVLQQRIRSARLGLAVLRDASPPNCVSVLGLSIGAIAAIPTAALESDVRSVVSILGGGGLEQIAMRSSEPRIQHLRRLATPEANGALRLQALDPLSWSAEIGDRSVLLIDAYFDSVVPRSSSASLELALKNSKRVSFPTGHYSFAVFLPVAVSRAIDHIRENCRSLARH